MYKGYSFKLYPNLHQEELLKQHAGACRWIYNYFLDKTIKHYKKTGKHTSAYTNMQNLTQLKKKKKYVWLNGVNSMALRNPLKNLDVAFKRFFKRCKQGKIPGFPKFKCRYKTKNSICFNQTCKWSENFLYLESIGWISARGNFDNLKQSLSKEIKSITVKNVAGEWYASCLIEIKTKKQRHPNKHVECGIDLGVVNPVTLAWIHKDKVKSTEYRSLVMGHKFSHDLRLIEKKRECEQKKLARKKRNSKNYSKQKLKVQRIYQREVNLRKNWVEQTSHVITRDYGVIHIEKLKLQDMTKNQGEYKKKVNRGMSRLSLGTLTQRIVQKANERGGKVIFKDPWKTSKHCPECGSLDPLNRQIQSDFECVDCGFQGPSDFVAAVNIMEWAYKDKAERKALNH